ncbi:hypothetical protein [Paraburkholderia sp. J94]|uniref:hypothetical protein n=1 Tax=Paraburkholderia sp. J94 TaxID=2805441 RepID=UPI002AB13C15|nr:hypothetical protein [Paraburkholderia sp. J94]
MTDNARLPRNFAAMMSGLCMTRPLLARRGPQPFDERLRLYGVDTVSRGAAIVSC